MNRTTSYFFNISPFAEMGNPMQSSHCCAELLFAHHADFGFSRPTDKFCPLNCVLRHACYRERSTDKFNRESCKMGAARARISGEQCGTPRPSVGPHSGSYGEAAQQSSPCCARIQHRIEQNRTFHRRYQLGSSQGARRLLAAQHCPVCCAELRIFCAAMSAKECRH